MFVIVSIRVAAAAKEVLQCGAQFLKCKKTVAEVGAAAVVRW
jgi:hypothetical protein